MRARFKSRSLDGLIFAPMLNPQPSPLLEFDGLSNL